MLNDLHAKSPDEIFDLFYEEGVLHLEAKKSIPQRDRLYDLFLQNREMDDDQVTAFRTVLTTNFVSCIRNTIESVTEENIRILYDLTANKVECLINNDLKNAKMYERLVNDVSDTFIPISYGTSLDKMYETSIHELQLRNFISEISQQILFINRPGNGKMPFENDVLAKVIPPQEEYNFCI